MSITQHLVAAAARWKPSASPLLRATVLSLAGAFVALELVLSARYGIHRDELYFLACSRHLAWGFVDQPPLVPAVAWLAAHIAGTSATSLRVLPALAGGGAVALTGLMARELGGRRKAQAIAAAAATSPQVLAACHLLSTAAFDQFFWPRSASASSLAAAYRRRAALAGGRPAGRVRPDEQAERHLPHGRVGCRPGPAVSSTVSAAVGSGGAAVALVIWMPNIIWNAQHHWAAIQMLHSLHQENSGAGASIGFIPSQLLVVGPVLLVLWVAGLRRSSGPAGPGPSASPTSPSWRSTP